MIPDGSGSEHGQASREQRTTTPQRPSARSDVLEFLDERTTGLGIAGAIASVILFDCLAGGAAYVGMFLSPLYIVLLVLALAPGLTWIFSSSFERPVAGLVGVGPSIAAVIGLLACISRDLVLSSDGESWRSWLLWPPAALLTSAALAWRVGLRRFVANRMAWSTAILSAAWVPLSPIVGAGWGSESHGARSAGPLLWIGMPSAVVLLHLVWASYAVAKRDDVSRLPLRIVARCEVVVATAGLVVAAYAALQDGGPFEGRGWQVASSLELAGPLLAMLGAMVWHGVRLTRWAAESVVDEAQEVT